MKRTHFILVVVLLASVITLASCWNICGCSPPEPVKTLKELLQGKTFVVKNVTKLPNINATEEFKDVKMSFDAYATSCFFRMSALPADTLSTSLNYSNYSSDNIILSKAPTNWANKLSNVKTEQDGSAFRFEVFITNPTTGTASYNFEMQRQ